MVPWATMPAYPWGVWESWAYGLLSGYGWGVCVECRLRARVCVGAIARACVRVVGSAGCLFVTVWLRCPG